MPNKQVEAQRANAERPHRGGTASSWVKGRMVTESAAAASERVPEESRQLTVRLQPIIAALFEGFAGRFKMSRNEAANLLIACALIDAVATLPKDERAQVLKRVEEVLGYPLDLSPGPVSVPEFPSFGAQIRNDINDFVRGLKDLFR